VQLVRDRNYQEKQEIVAKKKENKEESNYKEIYAKD